MSNVRNSGEHRCNNCVISSHTPQSKDLALEKTTFKSTMEVKTTWPACYKKVAEDTLPQM